MEGTTGGQNGEKPITKADLDAAVQQLKEYIDERTHDAETRLLRAFSDYNVSAGTFIMSSS